MYIKTVAAPEKDPRGLFDDEKYEFRARVLKFGTDAGRKRHYNGYLILRAEKKDADLYEGIEIVESFMIVIRERGRICSWMTGYSMDFHVLADSEAYTEAFQYLDRDAFSIDMLLLLKDYCDKEYEETEDIHEYASDQKDYDLIFIPQIMITDCGVRKDLHDKGYLSAMMDALYMEYGTESTIVATANPLDITHGDKGFWKSGKLKHNVDLHIHDVWNKMIEDKKQLSVNKRILEHYGFEPADWFKSSATEGNHFYIKPSEYLAEVMPKKNTDKDIA